MQGPSNSQARRSRNGDWTTEPAAQAAPAANPGAQRTLVERAQQPQQAVQEPIPVVTVDHAREKSAQDLQTAIEFTGGARSNLNRATKDREEWGLGLSPATWFAGGLRKNLDKQIAADGDYVKLCEAKERELAGRLGHEGLQQAATKLTQEADACRRQGDTSRADRLTGFAKRFTDLAASLPPADPSQVNFSTMLKASEKANRDAAQMEASGDRSGAARARAVANDLKELAPSVLTMPKDHYDHFELRMQRTLGAMNGNPPNYSLAVQQLEDAKAVVSEWNRAIDPNTGRRPILSRMADTTKLMAARREIAADLEAVTENLTTWETRIKVVAGIAVACVAVAASGGLALPAFLGGGVLGGGATVLGWLGGIGVGIGCGMLVGGVAAYGEAAGNVAYGKTWAEVLPQAHEEFKEHAIRAVGAVLFGKATEFVGMGIGAVGGFTSRIWTGGGSCGKFLLKYTGLSRLGGYFGKPLLSATASSATAGGATYVEGKMEQAAASRNFDTLAKAQPGIFGQGQELDDARARYLHEKGVDEHELLGRTARNVGTAAVASLMHTSWKTPAFPAKSFSTSFKTMSYEATRHGAAIGTGTVLEYMRDGNVSNRDVMEVVAADLTGSAFGSATSKGVTDLMHYTSKTGYAAGGSAATAGGMTYLDGQVDVVNLRQEFNTWVKEYHPEFHPDSAPAKSKERDAKVKAFEEKFEEFRELNGKSSRDILERSGRNAFVGGLASFLHLSLPLKQLPQNATMRQQVAALLPRAGTEAMRTGLPVAAGAAIEYARESAKDGDWKWTNLDPRNGQMVESFSEKVDAGDWMGIMMSTYVGKMFGQGVGKGYDALKAKPRLPKKPKP